MTPIKTLFLARDTTSITLFENEPVKEIYEDGFYFIDTKSRWFSEMEDNNLKNHIGVGEIIELPLIRKDFFDKVVLELDFLTQMFTKG